MAPQIRSTMIAPTVAPMKPAPLACFIPAERLAQIGRDKGANDAQNCGQDKSARLIVTGSDELRQRTMPPMLAPADYSTKGRASGECAPLYYVCGGRVACAGGCAFAAWINNSDLNIKFLSVAVRAQHVFLPKGLHFQLTRYPSQKGTRSAIIG